MILKSTPDGRPIITDGKKISKVIKLDLSESRDKEKYFVDTTEITFNIVDNPIKLCLNNNEEDEMTIVRPCSITTEITNFYISNEASSGKVEIWLWK